MKMKLEVPTVRGLLALYAALIFVSGAGLFAVYRYNVVARELAYWQEYSITNAVYRANAAYSK